METSTPEEAAMAKLRHVAINTQDLDADANFFIKAFDLKEVGRAGSPENGAVFLSDGVVNLALIKIADKDFPNYEPRGLNHIGFVVDSIDDTVSRATALGAHSTVDPNDRNAGVTWEMKMKAPNGVAFDLSDHGWPGITL
jgi:catechol 2,3-dioxygenase-like lactoylglutathione lyase family enzyme